nr:hypothetical protein [Tanacetum cinerariifolium]
MLRLVVEIDVVGITADVVNKVTCSFDGLQLKPVDLNHKFTLLMRKSVPELRVHLKLFQLHNISLIESLYSLQRSAREVDHSQQHPIESLCQQDLLF